MAQELRRNLFILVLGLLAVFMFATIVVMVMPQKTTINNEPPESVNKTKILTQEEITNKLKLDIL